jgi:hypothetical protein
MGQMDDGVVMARELHGEGFDEPIPMMSSISRATNVVYDEDAEIAPAAAFLEKLIKPRAFIARVEVMLNR